MGRAVDIRVDGSAGEGAWKISGARRAYNAVVFDALERAGVFRSRLETALDADSPECTASNCSPVADPFAA